MTKNCLPNAKQIKKFPKTVLCKECPYVQKYIIGKDEKIDALADTEQIFSHHILLKNLILWWKVLK